MKADTELEQAYRVFIDEKGIINLVSLQVVADPESNTRLAELIEQDFIRILDHDPRKKHMLVDLVPIGRAGYASSKARRIYSRMASHAQIGRFAIVGGSVLIRTMASFIIRAAGKGENMRWFADRETAIVWLEKGVENA